LTPCSFIGCYKCFWETCSLYFDFHTQNAESRFPSLRLHAVILKKTTIEIFTTALTPSIRD
jgi:hypothetical protein